MKDTDETAERVAAALAGTLITVLHHLESGELVESAELRAQLRVSVSDAIEHYRAFQRDH